MIEQEKIIVVLDYKIAELDSNINDFKELKNKYKQKGDLEQEEYWTNAIERNENIRYGLRIAKDIVTLTK